MKIITSESVEKTYKVAKEFAEKMRNGGVICLYGDLGSGKTTFTKGLMKALGVNEFTVKSPTFTYIRQYKNIYHIDLYRIDGPDELLIQELNEILENPKNGVIIEWAEKFQNYLPEKRTDIYLRYVDENTREIKGTKS